MTTDIDILLSQIPHRDDIIKFGTLREVTQILELVAKEFSSDEAYDPFAKVQDNRESWQWFIELPFYVSEYVQHAVRDHLATKEFGVVNFNGFEAFTDGYTRMSITVMKCEAK